MNRKDQTRIVNEMLKGITRDMKNALKNGHVPEEWDGIELRAWFADISGRYIYTMGIGKNNKRTRDFKNHLRINPNL